MYYFTRKKSIHGTSRSFLGGYFQICKHGTAFWAKLLINCNNRHLELWLLEINNTIYTLLQWHLRKLFKTQNGAFTQKELKRFLAKELKQQKLKLLCLSQIRTSFHLSIINSLFQSISQMPCKYQLYPQLPCGIIPHCMQGIISKQLFHDFSCGAFSFGRISFLHIDSTNSLSTLSSFLWCQ